MNVETKYDRIKQKKETKRFGRRFNWMAWIHNPEVEERGSKEVYFLDFLHKIIITQAS